MSPDRFTLFTDHLLHLNQASVLVPMVVVWWRRQHFSPAVRRLSLYVYLSAFCSLGMNFLCPALFKSNHGFVVAFNLGKILLFGAVYYRILLSLGARRAVLAATVAAVAGGAGMFAYESHLGVSGSRIMQCAVLAGFAMLYLEQTLQRPPKTRNMQDPFWLLSLGQLLYSAGTVTSFSLDHLSGNVYNENWQFVVSGAIGLVFNYFLTLAFLRADTPLAAAPVQIAAS
jgi:hypothetical protein